MRCRTAERWLSRALDRPLDDSIRKALESHLAGCAGCRAAASELRALRTRLSQGVRPEPVPGFWGRIERRLAEAPSLEPQAVWLRWGLRAIPASLAMIAGFLGAMILFLPASVETSPAQALLFGEQNPLAETRTIIDDDKPGNRDIAVLFAGDERLNGLGRTPRP